MSENQKHHYFQLSFLYTLDTVLMSNVIIIQLNQRNITKKGLAYLQEIGEKELSTKHPHKSLENFKDLTLMSISYLGEMAETEYNA